MSGLFGSRPQTATSTRETNATETTRGRRSPEQRVLFRQILDQLAETLAEGANVRPQDLAAMRGQVKGTYGHIAPRIGADLKSRGLGSGKPVTNANLRGVDIAQGNQMAAGRSALADLAQKRYAQHLGLALPYTRPTASTTVSSGTETGTQTRPGPSLFDQILGYGSQAAGIAAMLGAFSPAAVGGPFNAAGTGGASGPGYNVAPGALSGMQVPWGSSPGFGAMYGGI